MRVEEILAQELRQVADNLTVPALPPLPQQSPRAHRRWQPLLVAAAVVVLIAAGAVGGLLVYQDSRGTTSPAPPVAPSPTETPTGTPSGRPTETPTGRPAETPTGASTAPPLAVDAPTLPFLFDGSLYVAGNQLSGSWRTVTHGGDTWVAQRDDDTWWWGTDAEPHPVPGEEIRRARISPDGNLLAFTIQDGGQVLLIDTRSGETVNTLQIDMTGDPGPDALGVDAVTDDAKVFLSGDTERLMWLAAEGDETVDLATTASNQWVRGNTPAGLIVFDGDRDGESDATYLAEVSDSGILNRLRTLPSEEVVVNPSGTWLAYGGSWGGESQTIPEITAQTVDGSQQLALQPPDDRSLLAMTWEDDDLLLAELHGSAGPTGLARCSIREEQCWVIDVP